MIGMVKRSRLVRYRNVEDGLRQRRLELVARKHAMVKDIMTLSGEAKLAQLEDELTVLGEDLEETLMSLSPTTLSKLHKRLLDFDAVPNPLPPEEEMV